MNTKRWLFLMKIGDKLGCHQMPERSFFYKGYQFPVCARCTGVIISAVLALIVFRRKKIPLKTCFLLSSVMLIDWMVQYLEIQESNNKRRLVTGLIGGFGYSTLHLYFYKYIFDNIKKVVNKMSNKVS